MEEKKKITELFENTLSFQRKTRLQKALRHPEKIFLYVALEGLRALKISIPFRAKTFWGDVMAVEVPTAQSLLLYHLLESEVAMYFILGVNEGDDVLDIGTHYGYYSLLASKLTGPDGHVHSFEPTPRTFKILQKNTRSVPNIILNNKAVWNAISSIMLYDLGPLYSGGNTTKLENTHRSFSEIKVETCTIDSYCGTHIDPRFIKIDAEQAEREILNGGIKTIERCRPLICLEMWGSPEENSYYQDIFSFFQKRDYVAMVWLDNALRPAGKTNSSVQNYLFVPKGSELAQTKRL